MDFFETLAYITAPNSDNGQIFVDDSRLARIDELLFSSRYRKVNPDGLFVLYAQKPLHAIDHPVVISSHVDCVSENMYSFTEHVDADTLRGTFDNLITNAAVLSLMLGGLLPDNVLIAFTGDEEVTSKGALQLSSFLARRKLHAPVIVLDVTDMGYCEGAAFSIENNFFKIHIGKAVIDAALRQECRWVFVPSDPDAVPAYVPADRVIPEEAEEDESWAYDEQNIECFSLCLPVLGNMHSRQGVLARKQDCLRYVKALRDIASAI